MDVITRKALFLEDYKEYRKQLRKDEEMYESLYIMIWNRCGLEAQQLLEQQSGFAEISSQCDAIKLWNLIQDTFLRMDTYNDSKLASFTYNRYFNDKLFQQNNESVATFKERFEYAVNGFEKHGLNTPDDSYLALTFVDKLDERRFSNFKKEYTKDLKKGIKQPPENIQEALDEINKFRFNNPSAEHSGGYRNSKHQYSKNTAVYAVRGNSEKANESSDAKHDTKHDESYERSDTSNGDNASTSSKDKKEVICYGCREKGHIRPNCPKRKSNKVNNFVTKSSFSILQLKNLPRLKIKL